ncbi:hypothetical protein K3495_g7202 [Podosphaera aphanis]|nr:hypothetical protein K3495_g7202 [Podosphaera aphanis]
MIDQVPLPGARNHDGWFAKSTFYSFIRQDEGTMIRRHHFGSGDRSLSQRESPQADENKPQNQHASRLYFQGLHAALTRQLSGPGVAKIVRSSLGTMVPHTRACGMKLPGLTPSHILLPSVPQSTVADQPTGRRSMMMHASRTGGVSWVQPDATRSSAHTIMAGRAKLRWACPRRSIQTTAHGNEKIGTAKARCCCCVQGTERAKETR